MQRGLPSDSEAGELMDNPSGAMRHLPLHRGGFENVICMEGWCTVAARLTDRQKKKILADYVQLGSYNATAKINGCSLNTVKKLVQENADIAELCIQKKMENTTDILAYMESQRKTVCEIIGKGLAALNDPDKLAEATPAQITTALGTLIDKWTAVKDAADSNAAQLTMDAELEEFSQ